MDRTPAERDDGARRVSSGSLRALDVLNFFLADVRDGMGPFLGTFLREKSALGRRAGRHRAGGLADRHGAGPDAGGGDRSTGSGGSGWRSGSRRRRSRSAASCSTSCRSRWWSIAAQAEIGAAATFFGRRSRPSPWASSAARAMPRRTGRNEAFNHAGNVVAAALAGGAGVLLRLRCDVLPRRRHGRRQRRRRAR